MEQDTDEALMSRVAARDEAAFAMLYDRFSGALCALVKQIVEDERDAAEVLQEGFLYLWDRAGEYHEARSKAFTWAVIIFRHKAIERLRALRRRTRLVDQASLELIPLQDYADGAVGQAERTDLVRQALGALSQEQRHCIEWAFLKGCTHHQLAEMFGAPLGAVKTHIRRGLIRLRDVLKGGMSHD